MKSSTVKRELAVVRRILTLASRLWRDDQDRPWLQGPPPLIRFPEWNDAKRPYPLSWEEQRRLLDCLPTHLAKMALFGLNTGARDSVISQLQWAWETRLPELDRTVFIVPGPYTKNGTDCLIPVNPRAEAVLDSVRGQHDTHVFAYKGEPILRIHNTGWKKAWKAAGLPMDKGISKGPHNLRHTFARRLRAALVPHETIATLMHHVDGDVTLTYAPSQLEELFRAVDAILEERKIILRAVI